MMKTATGKTQIVGLIGWPVSHSISPQMHNAAFDALGLDWRYIPLPVDASKSERVREAIHGLRALGLRGCNVTVPHKLSVLHCMDRLTPAARSIGAVNTVRVEPDGAFLGDNTDAPGLIADMREQGVEPAGRSVLVLGAGGSARAAVFGLADAGAERIVIANRTVEKATALAADMRAEFPACHIVETALSEAIIDGAQEADLIVNCTSVGMAPNLEQMPWDASIDFNPKQIVYDLIYNPAQTRLLQHATATGARAMNGLGMLVWQGAISFELWTGVKAPVARMKAAVLG